MLSGLISIFLGKAVASKVIGKEAKEEQMAITHTERSTSLGGWEFWTYRPTISNKNIVIVTLL